MNIGSVSFASSAAQTSFQDKIRQPQTYVKTETPAAATGIKDAGKKKHPVRNAVIGVLVAGAAIAGGLVAGKHFDAFSKLAQKSGVLGKIGGYLETAGGAVTTALTTVKDKIVELLPKAKEHVNDVA